MPQRKQSPPFKGKITHIRADGTIVESMLGVIIPPNNGYYDVLARMAERLVREGRGELNTA